MAAAASSEPVKQTQKWVLRVPVDCEGCRKKVTKILHSIRGVESCDVDIKQQRVVVTGNVDAGTLIAKLVKKTGKHAELWPEPEVRRKKKLKEKRTQSETDEQRGPSEEAPVLSRDGESAEEGEGEATVGEDASQEENKLQKAADSANPPPHGEALVSEVNMKKTKGQIENEKNQHRVEAPLVDQSPINNNPPRGQNPTAPAVVNGQHIPLQSTSATNQVPPRHPFSSMSAPSHPAPRPSHSYAQSVYNAEPQPSWSASKPPPTRAPLISHQVLRPSYNYPRQQHVYTVSYSAAPQPSWSASQPPLNVASSISHQAPRPPSYNYPQQQPVYTVNYSSAPQQQASRSAYVHRGSGSYDPHPQWSSNYYNAYPLHDDQVDYDGYDHRQQRESFGLFSDENPNACLIM